MHIDPQPSDCDFIHAPLGDKGCHYEASVAAYNSAGQVVGGDRAPKYGHDQKTGKPIVSDDNGHTWWLLDNEPDKKVQSVVVTWSKVTE
jgi:hypothetical protein